MPKMGVRQPVTVVARALLLLLLVVGVSGMHSLAAGGSRMGTMSSASAPASACTSGAASMVVASTDHASLGAAATGSAPHSMGHNCVAVLTDAPGVAPGLLVPVAVVPGDLVVNTPVSALRAVGAALDRAPLRSAPSLSELSILRV